MLISGLDCSSWDRLDSFLHVSRSFLLHLYEENFRWADRPPDLSFLRECKRLSVQKVGGEGEMVIVIGFGSCFELGFKIGC